MPAPPAAPIPRHRGLHLLLTGILALSLAATVSGCVGAGSEEPVPAAATATSVPDPTPTRAPNSGAPTAVPTPTAAPPAAGAATLDPLAATLVGAGRTLSEGTAGLASVDARAALDQATTTLESDVASMTAAGASVDPALVAADIAAVLAATQPVRTSVVDSAIRVVNEEAPNADQALRDQLYLAIVDQQAQTAGTDDTPRQVLDLVAKVLAVQDSEAAFAAQQQAGAGEQRPDGGGPADAPAMHTFPPPAGGGPTETYCPDASHPDYCLPVGPLAPVG